MAERHVVITGISGGVGRHLAMRAMQEGYDVTGLCRTPLLTCRAKRLPAMSPWRIRWPTVLPDCGMCLCGASSMPLALRQ